MNDMPPTQGPAGAGRRKIRNLPKHHGVGFLVVLSLGLVLYLPLLCAGIFPVESAGFVALHSGASPLPSVSHPVWTGVVRLLAMLPVGALSLKLNLFSAACATLAVALLYRLLSRIETGARSPGTEADLIHDAPMGPPPPNSALLRHGPALIGALALAVSFPFWFVATRAHADTLSILLIVGGLESAAQYSLSGKKRAASLSALGFGLAATGSPAAAGIGAACAVWIAVAAHAHGHWSLPLQTLKGRARLRIGWLAAWACIGLAAITVPLLVRAALFLREPAAPWVGAETYGAALFEVTKAMVVMYRMAIPRLGAILLGAVILIPAGLVAMAIRSERWEAARRPLLVHLFASAFALAIVFDMPIAPWPFYGAFPLLTPPYLILALWFGCAAAGVTRLILGPLRRTDLPGRLSKRNLTPELRRRWASAYVLLMLSGLVVAGARNGIQIGRSSSAPFDAFARVVLDETRECDWLVSASPLNDLLAIKIAEAGLPLRILNPAQGRMSAYQAWIAESFPDDPRMRSLTGAGLDAALPDWVARDASVAGKLAILDLPSLWSAGRFIPMPGRTVYRGARDASPEHLESFAAELDGWRLRLAQIKDQIRAQPKALRPHGEWMLRHLGRLLNDRGALLESLGLTGEAMAHYRAAADHDPDNTSAALNLDRLARALSDPDADRYAAALQDQNRRNQGRPHSPEWAHIHGWIPEHRAGSTPTSASPGSQTSMNPIINPTLAASAFGKEAGQAEDADLLQWIREILELADTDAPLAANRVRGLRKTRAEDPSLLSLEAYIAWRAGDTNTLYSVDASLRKSDRTPPLVSILVADTLAAAGRLREARSRLEETTTRNPLFDPAWDALLRLDYLERRQDLAREHIARALRLNPLNPTANLYLASFHMMEDKFEEAESALRAALRGRPDDPVILNDLAWCLYRLKRTEDALPFAGKAVALAPNSAACLDTLGALMMEIGDFDRARTLLEKAARLAPDNPEIRERLNSLRTGRAGNSES